MSSLRTLQMKAIKALQGPSAPRIFSPTTLREWLLENEIEVSRPTVTQNMQAWTEAGLIRKIKHGVYLNLGANPVPVLEESAPWVREGAIVSLQTVLGKSGVLNNPTPWITCVYPHSKNPNNLTLELQGGTFRFTSINDNAIPKVSDEWYKDAFEPWSRVPTATPEKALLDWIYLGTHAYQWSLPPAHDIDWDELDSDKLKRLASHMGLTEELTRFKSSVIACEIEATTVSAPRLNP